MRIQLKCSKNKMLPNRMQGCPLFFGEELDKGSHLPLQNAKFLNANANYPYTNRRINTAKEP